MSAAHGRRPPAASRFGAGSTSLRQEQPPSLLQDPDLCTPRRRSASGRRGAGAKRPKSAVDTCAYGTVPRGSKRGVLR